MSWSGHFTIDPSELEARFSEEDSMSYLGSIFTEPTEEDLQKIQKVRNIMDLLPEREADFIDLYYFKKLRQTDIAEIFGVSQPTVCYRLIRAASRIRFLLNLPDVDVNILEAELTGFLSEPLDVRIMVLMLETTCQSEVASRLGVSQGLVRHRFLRTINKMKPLEHFSEYVKLFEFVAGHLNILREVQRPTWDDRITFCLR